MDQIESRRAFAPAGVPITSLRPYPEKTDGRDLLDFEEGERDESSWYFRAPTAREPAAIEADIAAGRAKACRSGDRFLGFAKDGFSTPMEAEPSEPSDESGPGEPGSRESPRPAFRHSGEGRNP